MTRIRRITVVATGLLGRKLLVVRRRLWWLGVPAAAMVLSAGLLATAPAASAATGVAAGVRLVQVGNDLLMAGIGPVRPVLASSQHRQHRFFLRRDHSLDRRAERQPDRDHHRG
jgi:hypothetical protein